MTERAEVGAYEAKTHLPELLRKVREGASFTITQRGAAVADLVPTGRMAQRSGVAAAAAMRTFMQGAAALARERAVEQGEPIDFKALIAEGRD